MVECPRCGGEMREGTAFVEISLPGSQMFRSDMSSMYMPMSSMSAPIGEMSKEKIQWREKTGKKTGRLIKRDEEKLLNISGWRCIECGYIDFYARE